MLTRLLVEMLIFRAPGSGTQLAVKVISGSPERRRGAVNSKIASRTQEEKVPPSDSLTTDTARISRARVRFNFSRHEEKEAGSGTVAFERKRQRLQREMVSSLQNREKGLEWVTACSSRLILLPYRGKNCGWEKEVCSCAEHGVDWGLFALLGDRGDSISSSFWEQSSSYGVQPRRRRRPLRLVCASP